MRSSIHRLFGLAAVTAVVAIGVPAVTSAANASEARRLDSSSEARRSGDDGWSMYYSKYYEGARAHARAKWYIDKNGRIIVGGKLHDRGSPSRLCGYVQVRFDDYLTEDRDAQYYSAKHCGSGYKNFRFSEFDAGTADLRVCYTDAFRGRHLCGTWQRIYANQGDA
jgi:hypothetical protein